MTKDKGEWTKDKVAQRIKEDKDNFQYLKIRSPLGSTCNVNLGRQSVR